MRVTIVAPRGTYPGSSRPYVSGIDSTRRSSLSCFEDREEAILSAIGAAAAHYFETTMSEGDVIGISSWSASLLRMVDAIHPTKRSTPNGSSKS